MDAPADFDAHGLRALRLLGQNPSAGRATWLAEDESGLKVVVKRFSFASPGASWEAFREHEREIAVLRELSHPSIPRFLDAFHGDDGFSLVQQWIDARPLSARQSFAPGELEAIAEKLLEVLVYLQARTPAVVHRDIKPDNILMTDAGRVYLVDFGLARSVHDSSSTIAVGTPGFMPPEQMLGHRLGPSADLYGLGATLIACLSGERGHGVRRFVDSTFRFDLDRLPVALDPGLRGWLERMVEPDLTRRFPDAKTALGALRRVHHAPARPPSPPPPRPRNNAAPMMIALAVAGAGAGIFVSTMHSPEVPELVTLPAAGTAFESASHEAIEPVEPAPVTPTLPTRCDGVLVIEHQDFTLTAKDRALQAVAGCSLTLRGVTIEGPGALIEARDGAQVLLENVTLSTAFGPALSVTDERSHVVLQSATVRATQGQAIAAHNKARVGVVGGWVSGPTALAAGRDAHITVTDTQVDGEVIEDGGYVFGIDPAADEQKRKQLRLKGYTRGACQGVVACFSGAGHRGQLDVQVVTRIRDGVIDAVRVVPFSGTTVSRGARDCITDAFKGKPIPDWDDDDVAYRVCEIGGQIHGGVQTISQGAHIFFERDGGENATTAKRLFR